MWRGGNGGARDVVIFPLLFVLLLCTFSVFLCGRSPPYFESLTDA
jgi:hypothetical protein